MGNRTSRPCGLGFRITEPSARCTKKARRPSAGDGWSFCRACWLQQQGTQTEKQAHHALWRKRKAAKELQEVPVTQHHTRIPNAGVSSVSAQQKK